MSSSKLRRAKSADRLSSDRCRADFDLAAGCKCDLVGFPYCCTKHYSEYRRWPYYLDPLDHPTYYRYGSRARYWPDWQYSTDYCLRRPYYYYYDDDYYKDYMRGYTEGLRKYDEQYRKRPAAATDLAATQADRYYPPYWWYSRPYYYYRRYV